MSKRSVFDQRKIEIVKVGAAKYVAPQSSEAPVIRPSPARNIDWNIEEGSVVRALAEIIVAHRPAGGEMRQCDQIRPVGSARSGTGLLDSRIHREWRAGSQRRNIQKLPSTGDRPSQRPQKTDVVERQNLNHAGGKYMRHVERRRSLLR